MGNPQKRKQKIGTSGTIRIKCKGWMEVPKKACYLDFMAWANPIRNYAGSIDWVEEPKTRKIITLETVRGESMILDLDKKGRVIGIELLYSHTAKKPCQMK